MKIDAFQGEVRDIPSRSLEPTQFQEDKGSDRFETSRWVRRRGMRHTNTLKFSNPICGILGFDLPGINFAQIIVSGANVYGVRNIEEHD